MWQSSVHPRQSQHTQSNIQDGHNKQIQILRLSLLQFVLRVVDNGGSNVLIDEEEEGEGEAQKETDKVSGGGKTENVSELHQRDLVAHFKTVF